MNKIARQSNIELLRIIAMLMIVGYHFWLYGDFQFSSEDMAFNRFWLIVLAMGGKIGVNLFVFISAYFLSMSKKNTLEKVLNLWQQIVAYAIIIFFTIFMLDRSQISIFIYKKTLLPTTFSTWWFASIYLFLLVLVPYLNRFIYLLSKKEHKKIILFLGIFWSVWATATNTEMGSSRLLWFVYLYIIASYIRNYQQDFKRYRKHIIWGILFTTALNFFAGCSFIVIGRWIPKFAENSYYLYANVTGDKSPLTLIISVLVFLFFLELKITPNKLINTMATTTFGIYLIHDHFFMRDLLWQTIFRNSSFTQNPFLILYSIIVILIVFSVCSLLSLLIDIILTKPRRKLTSWLLNLPILQHIKL